MKICYLIENINPSNGGGRYASDLINAVKKSGCEAVILKEQDDGLEGIPILKSGLGLFAAALKAKKYFKDCDVIHALDGYPFGIIAALANRGLNKKLIITIQGTYSVAPLYSFVMGLMLKWAYKEADEIISISHYTKAEVLKKINLSNIKIINHGINFEKFYKMPVETGDRFILSVGALKYRKGYHISIPAFALTKKEIPDLKYKIIGSQDDTAYFNELKKLAVKSGAENSIEFIAGIDDKELADIYQHAKLFILTSVNKNHHFEGFGLVFLEAAAAGLPAVGTLGNGIEDAIKSGYNGFLVPQNDIKATVDAITRILKDKRLRKEMSLNSLVWAKNHDWKNLEAKYINLYKNIL